MRRNAPPAQENTQVELFNKTVARRFGTESVTTFFAKPALKDPIAISRIVLPLPTGHWTQVIVPEPAYAVHVMISPHARVEARVGGRLARLEPLSAGEIFLCDLGECPTAFIEDPLETVRFHISRRCLDDLAYERGLRHVASLRPRLGFRDPVLHGLCLALLGHIQVFGRVDQLFLDNIALAFHSHVVDRYGESRANGGRRGRLAPWQLGRACELMTARMEQGTTIAELAEVCELSASHFARAFRGTTGLPPHQWLMNARMERAKALLEIDFLPLREIALACGFSDQSHFTRAFTVQEGTSPARWRRLRLG